MYASCMFPRVNGVIINAKREETSTVGTSPRTSVELDANADCSRVAAARHDAHSSSDDWRTDLAYLGDVRVAVASKHLVHTARHITSLVFSCQRMTNERKREQGVTHQRNPKKEVREAFKVHTQCVKKVQQ